MTNNGNPTITDPRPVDAGAVEQHSEPRDVHAYSSYSPSAQQSRLAHARKSLSLQTLDDLYVIEVGLREFIIPGLRDAGDDKGAFVALRRHGDVVRIIQELDSWTINSKGALEARDE